jgi:hypothetical protein
MLYVMMKDKVMQKPEMDFKLNPLGSVDPSINKEDIDDEMDLSNNFEIMKMLKEYENRAKTFNMHGNERKKYRKVLPKMPVSKRIRLQLELEKDNEANKDPDEVKKEETK